MLCRNKLLPTWVYRDRTHIPDIASGGHLRLCLPRASLTTLKRHGGWKSSTVAERYIEDSVENKKKISAPISKSVDLKTQNELQVDTSKQSFSTCTDPRPTSSKQLNTIYTDPQPSTSYEHVQTGQKSALQAEPQSSKENDIDNQSFELNNQNLSQTIQLAGKTITFNLQNCSNINFNFNK